MTTDLVLRAGAFFRGNVRRAQSARFRGTWAVPRANRRAGDDLGKELFIHRAATLFPNEVLLAAPGFGGGSGNGGGGGGLVFADDGRRRRGGGRQPPRSPEIPPSFERALPDWIPWLQALLAHKDDIDEACFVAAMTFFAEFSDYLVVWFPEFAYILIPLGQIARAYRAGKGGDKVEIAQSINEILGQKFGLPLALVDVGRKLSDFVEGKVGIHEVRAALTSALAEAFPGSKAAALAAIGGNVAKIANTTGPTPRPISTVDTVRAARRNDL